MDRNQKELRRRANARNISPCLSNFQRWQKFKLSTPQLVNSIFVYLSPTDAAPQFLSKLFPSPTCWTRFARRKLSILPRINNCPLRGHDYVPYYHNLKGLLERLTYFCSNCTNFSKNSDLFCCSILGLREWSESFFPLGSDLLFIPTVRI